MSLNNSNNDNLNYNNSMDNIYKKNNTNKIELSEIDKNKLIQNVFEDYNKNKPVQKLISFVDYLKEVQSNPEMINYYLNYNK